LYRKIPDCDPYESSEFSTLPERRLEVHNPARYQFGCGLCGEIFRQVYEAKACL